MFSVVVVRSSGGRESVDVGVVSYVRGGLAIDVFYQVIVLLDNSLAAFPCCLCLSVGSITHVCCTCASNTLCVIISLFQSKRSRCRTALARGSLKETKFEALECRLLLIRQVFVRRRCQST